MSQVSVYRERWERWRTQSANRRIFAAMVTVGALAGLAKLASMAKDLTIAHQFGTRDALDAFLIAFTLPLFAVNVVGASFNAALIPTLVEVRERRGRDAAEQLFSGVTGLSVVLLTVSAIGLALAGDWLLPLLGSRFSPEKLALTKALFLAVLPVLVVSGISTTWGAVLNTEDRYALAALAPALTAGVTLAGLLAFGDRFGIWALAVATVVGYFAEAAVIGVGLSRRGYSVIPRWGKADAATRTVLRQYAPTVAGACLMSSTTVINQAMAAMLGPGSVAALNYGNKLVALLVGVAAIALSSAVLPHFSRMTAQRDGAAVRHTLRTYTRLLLLASVPLTIALVVLSEPLVRLLFQRGAFTDDDARLVGRIQALYLLQVPPQLVGYLLVRLISALKANVILMTAVAVNLLTNVVFNYVLMRWLGAPGIALATAGVYLVSTVFCAVACKRLLAAREHEWRQGG